MCDYDILFDIYDKATDFKDDNEKIKYMPQLLGHFYNYLNNLILVLNDSINTEIIISRKQKLIKNIHIILNFYKNIKDRNKFITIYYLFIDLMTLAIIILYSYIYLEEKNTSSSINIFTKYLKKNKMINNIKKIFSRQKKDSFFRDIIIEILTKIGYINPDMKNDPSLYTILKERIYGEIYIIDNLYDEIKKIITEIVPLTIDENDMNNEIITIMQYEGICWFIAFLTCICYSDLNRQIVYDNINIEDFTGYDIRFNNENDLILADVNNILDNMNIRYDEMFKIFVYIIIKYISNDSKTYNDYSSDILVKLKDIIKKFPIKILEKIKNAYINRQIGNYTNSDYNFLKNKKRDEDYYGIDIRQQNFYKIFYKILDIKIYFLIKDSNFYYNFNDDDDVNDNSPDIFLISYMNNIDKIFKTSLTRFEKEIKIINNDTLTFNSINYKLDYIIFINASDTPKNIYKKKNNGHAVSAITHKNNEYLYDSRYPIFSDYYKGHNISCPLIKQKWKNKITNNYTFCLKKCFYTEINIDDKISKIIKNSSDDMCYKYTNNYTCCYVKENSVMSGGTNEKLKSTNTKINIVINNKKIQRTVYINKNGIKVIKYNNNIVKIYNNDNRI